MATERKKRAAVPSTATAITAAPRVPTAGDAPPRELVAARAYEIWQESGRPHGQAESHWYQAERELLRRPPRLR
jgi:hypothetical protein